MYLKHANIFHIFHAGELADAVDLWWDILLPEPNRWPSVDEIFKCIFFD